LFLFCFREETMEAKLGEQSLGSLFVQAWNAHQKLGTEVPEGYERDVVCYWKEVESRVTSAAIFSPNEIFDDVQTSSIRHLFVPYFMAEAELQGKDFASRLDCIKRAEGYLTVFLMRLDKLEILNQQDRNAFDRNDTSSQPASQKRTEMIARAKEADQQNKTIERIGKSNILLGRIEDEDKEREYLQMMLSYYAFAALRELNLINQEIPLLEMHAQASLSSPEKKPLPAEPKRTLTQREEMIQGVFRFVNPPTMSIEEAGEIEYQLMLQKQAEQHKKGLKNRHSDEEEERCDDDDAADLKKKRDWDDWKDDNPRGWGNRMNQG